MNRFTMQLDLENGAMCIKSSNNYPISFTIAMYHH